jgi:hypothetical protein
MELSEYPFSEGFLNSFEVYFPEAGEDAAIPVSVSEESMKVGVIATTDKIPRVRNRRR